MFIRSGALRTSGKSSQSARLAKPPSWFVCKKRRRRSLPESTVAKPSSNAVLLTAAEAPRSQRGSGMGPGSTRRVHGRSRASAQPEEGQPRSRLSWNRVNRVRRRHSRREGLRQQEDPRPALGLRVLLAFARINQLIGAAPRLPGCRNPRAGGEPRRPSRDDEVGDEGRRDARR
jgi:hypothetical protein